jgi:type I restriction enzyme S subunit
MKAGWKTEPLGDLCEFQRGLTYAKGDEVDVSDNIVLRATNIDLTTNLLDFNELKYINDKVVVPETRKVKKGSLIICTASGSKSHLGKVAYIDDDYGYAFGGFMGMITPKSGLVPKYLFHLMTSDAYKDFIGELSDGANINNLRFDDLGKFQVPHPKPDEQQRIVGILDEAFAGIATAKANAEKNLQNARALFESHLQSVFTQRGPGWVENKLQPITTKIGSGATPRGGEESYKSEGVSLIRSLNVHDLGFRYPKLAFLDDAQADELSNVEVQPRDVLLNITGASVARCCIVPEDVLPARVNQHVSIIRPVADKLDADFLHYLLISKPYKDQLLQTGAEGGSTRQAITKAQIQDFSVKYPAALKEQKSIVAKLDAMLAETQRLAALYERKLAALEALKKSLLHQAFTGQL